MFIWNPRVHCHESAVGGKCTIEQTVDYVCIATFGETSTLTQVLYGILFGVHICLGCLPYMVVKT